VAYHRVGIINDFRDTHAFVEFRSYGTLSICNASNTGGSDRSPGGVHVFVNMKKVQTCHSKDEAKGLIPGLMEGFPPEARKMVEGLEKHLYEALGV
jgi:hypothetical protein